MLKVSTLKLQVTCPGCNNFHTVTGFIDFEACQNCGRNINIASVLNERMFGIMDRQQYLNNFVSGKIEQIGSDAYKLEYSSMPAYCEECNTVLDENILEDSINKNTPTECPKCNHKMPVRGPDSLIKKFHPDALGVVNDSFGVDAGTKTAGKESMIVFPCMTCGGALQLDSNAKRLIKCTFCGNENYLPDAIWTKLHPNRDVVPLFLITSINDDDIKSSMNYFLSVTSVRIYGKHFENFIREYFEKPFVSEALLSWIKHFVSTDGSGQQSFNMNISGLQKYFYDNLKLGADYHPDKLKETVGLNAIQLPVDIQQLLSKDKNVNVRLALIKNKNTDKDVIKILHNDPDSQVSSEARKIKTGFFGKLFG